MFEHNPGCVIGRTVDNENLPDHSSALEAFLAPVHEFAHSDFLIRSGDNDTQFYVVETRGFTGMPKRVLKKVPRGDDDRAMLVLERQPLTSPALDVQRSRSLGV